MLETMDWEWQWTEHEHGNLVCDRSSSSNNQPHPTKESGKQASKANKSFPLI